MKKQNQEEKREHRFRSLCSMSGLLLSVVCCIAIIHVELRIQEHHRLISHSVTTCDQLETQILRKVQQNYEDGKMIKAAIHKVIGGKQEVLKFLSCRWLFQNTVGFNFTMYRYSCLSLNSVYFFTQLRQIFVKQNFNFVDL